MKNSLNRFVPEGYIPFKGSTAVINEKKRVLIDPVLSQNNNKLIASISEVFDKLKISDGATLSFHHHLRNGDYVLNLVCEEIKKRDLKNITIAASSIFPTHAILCELFENNNVTNIYANYMNGPVPRAISQGKMSGMLVMNTHGGRPRKMESGELKVDVAFIATPTATPYGDGNGIEGKSACGALGYAISDMLYAKHKVVVTDNLADSVSYAEIQGKYIDYVVKVDSIGDPKGIVSGTTKVTRDPMGLKIARDAAKFLDEAGYIVEGFTMQTGAGGTSLAVADKVKDIMISKGIKAKMASGGITGYFVNMLESGLIEQLKDVQCFDLEAVRSYRDNKNHLPMDASKYGNPYDNPVVNELDFVVLAATEVDLDFNVNVTTDSLGYIIGGSGGHSDTANGAKCTVIVTPLMKSRTPIIRKRVTTVTTPGEDVDVIVTERGIAINPRRTDLIEKMKYSKLNIVPIEKLYDTVISFTKEPKEIVFDNRVVGVVEYRDGTTIDTLFKVRG